MESGRRMEADQSELARLEAALERIAAAAAKAEARADERVRESEARLGEALGAQEAMVAELRAAPGRDALDAERAALAARIDRLIERLSAALSQADGTGG